MVGMMGWGAPGQGWRKGPWTPEEDKLLAEYVRMHGEGRWTCVAQSAGLNRSGKSCRLRWVNYLRPGLKRGQITPQEEGIIIELHALWGNKWSTIARYLPGRTDNEIKNYWRTHFKKKAKPSQMQEKRKIQVMLQQKKEQEQQTDMTNRVSTHPEKRKEKIIDTKSKQDMVLKNPSMEDGFWLDTIILEDDLWGGLWSLDAPHDHFINQARDLNKTAIQNQAVAYSPTINLYNQ